MVWDAFTKPELLDQWGAPAPTEAEDIVIGIGLNEVKFSRVGKLSSEKVNSDEKREYYNNAMKTGSTLIVYSDPI